jgi:8-oxo-dGTP pyrophosphatase MutT (NUDIX family)
MKKASGVIVKHGDKCLLCKRNSKNSLGGEWSIPAGKLEQGEEPVDAAHREFYEETHKRIKTPLFFQGVLKRFDRTGEKQTGMMYVFATEVDEPIIPNLSKAKDGDEHTECGYFNLENLPTPMNNPFKNFVTSFLNS